jgi:hypothetical protein|tara:strand:- start:327 stop:638 length:312 start_codon:yes stop_codon:yes gene_type:complete
MARKSKKQTYSIDIIKPSKKDSIKPSTKIKQKVKKVTHQIKPLPPHDALHKKKQSTKIKKKLQFKKPDIDKSYTESNSPEAINNPFREAFAKAGLTADDFKKK